MKHHAPGHPPPASFSRRPRILARTAFAASVLLAVPGVSVAGPTVHLEAAARSELPNDEMVVQLAVERAGPAPEKLNGEVLDALNLALAKARTVDGVKARLGSITTQPDWGPQGKRTGWRVRGLLVLEGRDLRATGALAGELSSDLQIDGVSFRLTEEARAREQARLIGEAAAAFKARAQQTAKAFGYEGFDLKTLVVDHAATTPPPRPMQMEFRGAAASAPMVPADGGETTVTLTIGGSVELK
jgi:predicted secreted protein